MQTSAFRSATPADIDANVALVTSAYRGDVSRQGWTTEADLLDGQRVDADVLRLDIGRPRSRIVLAERQGILLACAHVAEEDGAGYFGMFSVRPDLQGLGVNAIILDEMQHKLVKAGFKYAESGPMLEINDNILAQWARFENVQHKRRRCFVKEL